VASRKRTARVASRCLSLPGAAEDYPFGDEVAVFKVAGKMFALLLDSEPAKLTLKCDPNRAVALRERYRSIVPGYHSNKRHWNTIDLDGSVPEDELFELIDHSYELVAAGLTKAQRDELGPGAGRP
jgi:predicted DNA-binding protein (MmcQ/YjbR family)